MIHIHWLKLNYFYLIVVVVLALLMRSIYWGISLPYENMLHTHSHLAFLGWVYTTLFFLLVNTFLDKQLIQKHWFSLQFIITHLIVLAMMISFMLQSYGFYSILFSSIFQLMNYWFIFSFIRALNTKYADTSKQMALPFLKIALWALFASTFGPWAVAIIKAAGLAKSDWYSSAIYFYLHFYYNGWIIFALLALFFKDFKNETDMVQNKQLRLFFLYMSFALIPAYFLSLLGIFKNSWVYSFAATAAILQLYALYNLIRYLFKRRTLFKKNLHNKWLSYSAVFVLIFFCLKIVLQFLSVVPDLYSLAFENRDIIMAYIHLVTLGIITLYLFIRIFNEKYAALTAFAKSGLMIFGSGFVCVELLLALQFSGIFLDKMFLLLAVFTAFILTGILFIYSALFKNNTFKQEIYNE